MSNAELQERLIDLLVAEATGGLSHVESAELIELKNKFPDWRYDESIQLTVATIQIAAVDAREPIPVHLEKRILQEFEGTLANNQYEPSRPAFSLFGLITSRGLGWAVAACLATVLALDAFQSRPTAPVVASIAEQREAFISSAADAVRVSWTNTDDPHSMSLSGDIVWSNAEQRGYMRFRGLPTNDRTKECYQLWIFDTNQSEKTPVDGGVFNAETGDEIIVPIDAKLRVSQPTLFAVTVEKPGGVVVSSREHIAALAKVGI